MTDTIIVGGGIIGFLTAYELSNRGHQVTVFDKGLCGCESSWAGGGILSPLYPWRYPDAVTELARWSQQHYQSFTHSLLQTSGIDPEWTQSGLLMASIPEQERGDALAWGKRFGYRLELLQPDEVVELAPGIATPDTDSLWMEDVAQVRNPRLFSALRKSAELNGLTVRENCAITGIRTRNGRATGVEVERGFYRADNIVIASGAWSGLIAGSVGVELPVRPVRGQMLLFHANPGLLNQIVLSGGYYLIPRRDGRILVGSTLEETGFDKSTTDAAREELLTQAFRILPKLKNVELERQWAGLRPGTQTGVPFIGKVPDIDGLYVNAGQYRNGVVMGLASGRLLADIITGGSAIVPPEPYRLR